MVKEVSQRLSKAKAIILTSYKGLTNQDIAELRGKLKTITSNYLIVKNSIARLALGLKEFKEIEALIDGPIGIVHNGKDPCQVSRILVEFSRSHEALIIKGGLLDNTSLTKQDIIVLASLPPREVLLTKIAVGLNSPIVRLVNVLQANIRNLVSVLDLVRKKKENEG